MISHERGFKINYHYSFDVGWRHYYSAEKPTELKAENVTFINEGTQIGDPVCDPTGKPIAKFIHKDNGNFSMDSLPVELETLPGKEEAVKEMWRREDEI